MAGVDGVRQRHNNQTNRQENGDGWRSDEEDREGKGKRVVTVGIEFYQKVEFSCALIVRTK